MKIPILDLSRQYQLIKKEINTEIQTVLNSGNFVGGKFVENFEKNVATYCGTKYAISLNSGTDALYLSLRALGIGKGDEVITSPFSFIATVEAIMLCGATPIFVDIDLETYCLDPKLVEEKITSKTRAIIPVHLFGQTCAMQQINKIAKKYNLSVVEDACQSIGATYKEKRAGALGTIGCFSFYPTKNLGAYGDGGVVTTNNKKLAQKINMLKNHGSIVRYKSEDIGINSRLDSIQASILSVKLKYLEEWNRQRREIAQFYSNKLKEIPNLIVPRASQKTNHVYHQYTLRLNRKNRNKFIDYLKSNGIGSMIYYPIPLHLQPALKSLTYKKGDFPKTEKASKEVISIPIFPELNETELSFITEKIIEYFKA